MMATGYPRHVAEACTWLRKKLGDGEGAETGSVSEPSGVGVEAVVLLAAVCCGGLGCNDDTVEVEYELGSPYCMIAFDTRGYFADGSSELILWPQKSPAGCGCSPEEDRWDEDFLAALNERAYEDCVKAAGQWNFAWDECLENYEAQVWVDRVWYAGDDGDRPIYRPADLYCTDGTPGR